MCYSQGLSLASLATGVISGALLIYLSSAKYLAVNKVIGYFFISVSVMQFVDFLMWSDMECRKGLNKFATIIGPPLNLLQPQILLFFCRQFLPSNGIIPENVLIAANTLYTFFFMINYWRFLNRQRLCTTTNASGHLEWEWNKNSAGYGVMVALNIANYVNHTQLFVSMVTVWTLLLTTNLKETIGSAWCFLAPAVPIVNIVLQRVY